MSENNALCEYSKKYVHSTVEENTRCVPNKNICYEREVQPGESLTAATCVIKRDDELRGEAHLHGARQMTGWHV